MNVLFKFAFEHMLVRRSILSLQINWLVWSRRLICSLLIASAASSWGYSGAGGECGDALLERAVTSGSLDEVTHILDERAGRLLALYRDQFKPVKFLGFTLKEYVVPSRPSHEDLRKALINRHNGCDGVLLDFAVAGGNLPVIDGLLAFGADVEGTGMTEGANDSTALMIPGRSQGSTLLERCLFIAGSDDRVTKYVWTPPTEAQRARTRSGYEYIISKGANAKAASLKACRNADVLKILLSHGANPNELIGYGRDREFLRDAKVMALFEYGSREGYGLENGLAALDEILSRTGAKMPSPRTERKICEACSERKNEYVCSALKRRIQLVDERMFDTTLDLTASDRREVCEKYQQEDTQRPRVWRAGETPVGCSFEARYLPKDFVVVGGGGDGVGLGFQIDDSGKEAEAFEVLVHADKPVALMLSPNRASIWSVSWSEGTKIVAVILEGEYRQEVLGLPDGVPVVKLNEVTQKACGGHTLHYHDNKRIHDSWGKIRFGREPVSVHYTNRQQLGLLNIIESNRSLGSYQSTPRRTIESFRNPEMPFTGYAGVNFALQKGLLRPATEKEIEAIKKKYGWVVLGLSAYTVIKPMTLPGGPYWQKSVAFIVPKGIEVKSRQVLHGFVAELD